MPWQESLEVLKRLGMDRAVHHVKTVHSSVTTAWGVDWTEDLIARDLMQNFYDANRDRVSEIQVCHNRGTSVVVSAPAEYNLERLFYLGSEKGPDDVGQYGEGFKVAATCLLRDHGVTPVATSGAQVLCMRIADEPVEGTKLLPLVYDFFATNDPTTGTRLILPHCSPRLVDAMQKGLTHFYYEGNPLLDRLLWSSTDERYAIRAATGDHGCAFYRGLRRGEIRDIPIVLVIHQELKTIENRIKNDRDRNAFGEKIMEMFYKEFSRKALRGNLPGQRVIVEAAKDCWPNGHGLLSAIAETAVYWAHSMWNSKVSHAVFGDAFFARCTTRDPGGQLEYDRLERAWQQEGRRALPGYFARLGVLSADRYLRDLKEKARQESLKTKSKAPTPAEANGLAVLKGILGKLSPTIAALIEGRVVYTVAATDAVLGELKEGRKYQERHVFLAERVFAAQFPEALAVFLHEHAHIFGYDGSRSFTDALTELLETVVRHRKEMDTYESDWEAACKEVEAERRKRGTEQTNAPLEDRLAGLSESELRELMAQLPQITIARLLHRE